MTSRDVTIRRHMTSHNKFWGERTRKCPTLEVRERSGVFFNVIIDREARRIIRLVASVRPSVSALTVEPFDL